MRASTKVDAGFAIVGRGHSSKIELHSIRQLVSPRRGTELTSLTARGFASLVALVCVGTIVGCGHRPVASHDGSPPDSECTDVDGDGHGQGCDLGPDCDDRDPSIGEDSADCRSIAPVLGTAGRLECFTGTRSCREGVWGECESLEAYPPLGVEWGAGDDDGVDRDPMLGEPVPCSGSCDLGCMTIVDNPGGADISPSNSSNLVYDPVDLSPPALVIEDPSEDGVFTRTVEATCAGPSQWWALTFVGVPSRSDEAGMGRLAFRVRTASSLEELEALGEEAWVEVVACPGDGCELPATPTDRLLTEQGNLFEPLGGQPDAGLRYLEYEARLSARDTTEVPRLTEIELYFICLDE